MCTFLRTNISFVCWYDIIKYRLLSTVSGWSFFLYERPSFPPTFWANNLVFYYCTTVTAGAAARLKVAAARVEVAVAEEEAAAPIVPAVITTTAVADLTTAVGDETGGVTSNRNAPRRRATSSPSVLGARVLAMSWM